MKRFNKVLIKLSGEALTKDPTISFDSGAASLVADALIQVHNQLQLAVVIGGGNIIRGRAKQLPIPRPAVDEIGMLATVMNGLVLKEAILQKEGKAVLFNTFPCGSIAEPYSRSKALQAFSRGEIVIFSGGTAQPFLSTDTVAAIRAAELEVDALVKCTTVCAVYDKDPKVYPDATRKKRISYRQILTDGLAVMDFEAILICEKQNIPIMIAPTAGKNFLQKALFESNIGTVVTSE